MAAEAATPKDPRTLVIVAHPSLREHSRANRRWVQELERYPREFAVHDLFAELEGAAAGALTEADVAREQALLAAHDLVVFQFPVYWYSCPPLLRAWADAVYSLGWAYGGAPDALPGQPGRMLAGKRMACAVTAGDVQEHYRPDSLVGFTMDQVLAPFWATAKYLEMDFDPHAFAIYGADFDLTDDEIEASAAAYVQWLRALRGPGR